MSTFEDDLAARSHNSRNGSIHEPNQGGSTSDRRETLQQFEYMMNNYHLNFRAYNQNIQHIIDGITSSRNMMRNAIEEFTTINGLYNENIRAYTDTVHTSLNIYRDIYFGQVHTRHNNTSYPAAAEASDTQRSISVQLANTILRGLSRRNRPHTFVNYTVFPIIPPVADTNDHPLTSDQIRDFTEEYLYNADVSRTDLHFCSISLDMFQEGERILRIRQCGHEFKADPLLEWFQRSSKCPLCRCNLLTTDVSGRSSSETHSATDPILIPQVNITDVSAETVSPPQHTQTPVIAPTSTLQSIIQNSIQNGIQEILSNGGTTSFNDVFEQMLMSNTNAPPSVGIRAMNEVGEIGMVGEHLGSNIEPLLQSIFRDVIAPIESIDITYTVDTYDPSYADL